MRAPCTVRPRPRHVAADDRRPDGPGPAAPRESPPSRASAAHRLRSGQPQCAATSRRAAMHRRADAVASGASTSRSPRSQATSARSSPTRRAVSPPAVASSRCRQSREGMVRCRWFMPGEVSAGGVPGPLIFPPPSGVRSPGERAPRPSARAPANHPVPTPHPSHRSAPPPQAVALETPADRVHVPTA